MNDISMLMTRGSARRARIENAEDPAEIKKRSVVISGHRTSISLENVFWEALRTIAVEKGISVNQLVTDIDRQRTGNLSSAIRTFVLLDAIGD